MEFTLLWAAATGVGAALLVAWWEKSLGLLPAETGSLSDLILGAAVSGLIAGRLAAMVLSGTSPFTHPGDILIVRSGVDTGFASLGALTFVSLTSRRNLAATIDALGPAALAGLGGWHAGCLFRGACLGTTSSLPWAVAQEGSTITRHPVEIYAALFFLVAAFVLLAWLRGGVSFSGVIGAAALAIAGAIRLMTEPRRPSLGTGPVAWYVAAIAIGLGSLLAVRLHARRSRQ
jgi:prolipoprotein diacylglyceryltransferase